MDRTYGHPHIISLAYNRTIINLPKISSFDDYKTVLNFETTLRGAAASLKNGGYEFELKAGGLLESVVEKLPSELQSKWGKKVVKSHPEYLTLQDFIDWLHPIVKGEMVIKHGRFDTSASRTSKADSKPDAKQDRKQGRQSKTKSAQSSHSVLATAVQQVPVEDTNMKKNDTRCPLCPNEDHALAYCVEFKKKSASERISIVRESGSCRRCLRRGHISRKCNSK